MNIKTDINKYKKQLINKAKEKGLYEDFGQKEVNKLEKKHIDISKYNDEMNERRNLIQDFNNWCMNFNDPNIMSFDELYTHLRDKDLGNWDNVNSEETIEMYCSEMMKKGIHISHIIKALEENPSEQDLHRIWLGNSMETPTPINTKQELIEALEIEGVI